MTGRPLLGDSGAGPRRVTKGDVDNAIQDLNARGLLSDTAKSPDGTRSATAWVNCIMEDMALIRLMIEEAERGEDIARGIAVALKEARRLQGDLYRYAREVHGIERERIDAEPV